MKSVLKYIRIYKAHIAASFDRVVATKLDVVFLVSGKCLRLCLEYAMIAGIFRFVPSLQGYTCDQVLMFTVTMWIVDLTGQMFLRKFYWIGDYVRNREFDRFLSRPLHTIPLLIAGGIDFFDLATLPLVLGIAVVTISRLEGLTAGALLIYFLWLVIGWITQFSFFLLGGVVGIFTYESHSYLYIFRQLQRLGSYPMDIYPRAVQFFFTFIVPLFVIMMLPTKALLGVLEWRIAVGGFLASMVFLGIVYSLWRLAIRTYMIRGG